MILLALLAVAQVQTSGASLPADSARSWAASPAGTAIGPAPRPRVAAPPADPLARAWIVLPAAVDTPPPQPRPRPRAVEVSEGYETRLRIHRYLAYATIPIFAFQYAAGDQLWKHGAEAPAWARTGHRIGATALAGIFTVNTVTGAWNLWETRHVPEGRALRLVHALSMLAADAGFVYAGAVLAEQAETDPTGEKRRQHRAVALTSIGITVTSGTLMFVLNR